MSFLCDNLNLEEKHIYLGCLAHILGLTKNPDEASTEYLQGKIKEVCLSPAEFGKIKPLSLEKMAVQLKTIKNIVARRYILRDMILLSTANHELSDKEVDAIYKIGMGSGISQDKIDDLFMWAAQGVAWQIEGTRLIEEDI